MAKELFVAVVVVVAFDVCCTNKYFVQTTFFPFFFVGRFFSSFCKINPIIIQMLYSDEQVSNAHSHTHTHNNCFLKKQKNCLEMFFIVVLIKQKFKVQTHIFVCIGFGSRQSVYWEWVKWQTGWQWLRQQQKCFLIHTKIMNCNEMYIDGHTLNARNCLIF